MIPMMMSTILLMVASPSPAQQGQYDGGGAPSDEPAFQERTVRTTITEVGDSMLSIENPDYPEKSVSTTAPMWVPEQAQIFRRCGTLMPATFGDLRAGQQIELTFRKASPLGDPPPGVGFSADAPTAIRIVILEEAGGECTVDTKESNPPGGGSYSGIGDTPSDGRTVAGLSTLPATGGAEFVALGAGALLIAAGVVIRRVFR
jgi:hypothetical protein